MSSSETQGGAFLRLRFVLQFLIIAAAVWWAVSPRTLFGEPLFTEQFLALCLGLGVSAALFGEAESRTTPAGIWGWRLAALLSLLASFYLGVRFPDLLLALSERPADVVVICVIVAVGSLVAVWRTSGLGILVVALCFVLYALLGHLLPGEFQSRYVAWDRLAVYLGTDSNSILGSPLAVACVIVLPFLVFGNLLTAMGAAEFFTDLAAALMGRYRGGAAKIAVTASALFGTISGSAVANVVGTGVVTIPLMKRSGFKPEQAGAVEAVASTGGQLMPPVMGAAAFLMADFLQVSYGEVMIAAILPALLYYLALFVQVDLIAARDKIRAIDSGTVPSLSSTMRAGWHFLLPFVALVYGLFWMNMQPEYAALTSCVVLLAVGFARGYKAYRPTFASVIDSIVQAGGGAREIIAICAMAGIVIGILNLTGIAFNLSMQLISASGGNIVILVVLTALISIVLGMGMPTVGVYVLLATLVAPALIKGGISPMAAHMFVMYFGMLSMVTPPVALAAFAGANIAGADPWKTGWTAARLGWSAYVVPFLFVFSPNLLLDGDPAAVVWASITAVIGIYAATAGIVGQFFGTQPPWVRVLLFVGGVLALIPANTFPGASYSEAAGLIIIFGLGWLSRSKSRRTLPA
jgi:TRAP transporter 4TM/12TM fusion protein